MAWDNNASGVRKTPIKTQSANDESSFPGLKGPELIDKTEYEDIQQNEVLALEAIYGDDFVMHNSAHGAWKVC